MGWNMDAKILEEGAQLFKSAGICLWLVQMIEDILSKCLVISFPEGGSIRSIEQFDQAEEATRKKTLGQLMNMLKGRVGIKEDFAINMDRFLYLRNFVAHRLFKEYKWWALSFDQTSQLNLIFKETIELCELMRDVFYSVIVEHSRQLGIKLESDPFRDFALRDEPIILNNIFYQKT
jgi:hypothetical protein